MEEKSLLTPGNEDVSLPIKIVKPQSSPDNENSTSPRCFFVYRVVLLLLIFAIFYTLYLMAFDSQGMPVKLFYSHSAVHESSTDITQWSDYQLPDHLKSVDSSASPSTLTSCDVPTASKIDCLPGLGSDEGKCNAKGCCWVPVRKQTNNTPQCFRHRDDSDGYLLYHFFDTNFGYELLYIRKDKSIWPEDVMSLQMDIYEETASRLHFKIYDRDNKRYEVPIDTPPVTPSRPSKPDYQVEIAKLNFGLKVSRADGSGTPLFDTNGAKLTFADQFIEITTTLPTNYIYGLGERRDRLLHDVSKGFTMSMWAASVAPAGCVNCNLYGQHPFFIGLEDTTGKAYGVFLLNSNAMEVKATPKTGNQPAQLTYRTIGGILDFYVFTGPSPTEVVQQYLQVIGHPYLPPYWGLGYHLCRWGYQSTDHMKAVIKRVRDYGFPYDTQWNDIDYMHSKQDWTYDKKNFSDLPAIVQDLHDNGQHYMMIVDPGIANVTGYPVYDEGVKEGVFIMHADRDAPLIGKVWPGYTAYPDFFSNVTQKWWLKQAQQYHQEVPFDGMWTDMNEPANFVNGSIEGCSSSKYDNPPYTPGVKGGILKYKTICPSARHHNDVHYNLHSLYGHSELIASQMALHEIRPGRRTVVISRSTFPSSGKYAGHWTGDNDSSWDDLKYSIPGILNFQFFGIPFVGADICGFMGNSNGELCVRWTQLGAFYPFMRNHNTLGSPDQDPGADMFNDAEKQAMLFSLRLRYTLLPYLYTLLARAHVNGTTVARPLWFEYPNDVALFANDRQLMWGESIMIAPVLDQGVTSVKAYFPADTWVDYVTGDIIKSTGQEFTISAPLDKIPVYVRAGGIIPLQKPDVTTTKSRMNPFALNVVLDEMEQACGSLYWDDGETLNATEDGKYNQLYFQVEKGKLTSSAVHSGYTGAMKLDTVFLYNVPSSITSVTVNGVTAQVHKTGGAAYTISFSSVDFAKPILIVWN